MENFSNLPNAKISTPYSQEFWDNYSLFLVKQGVSKKYVTWYILRTKQYIAAFPEVPVREHQPEQVEQYLNKVGREHRLKDWQFAQIVDAIQLVFSVALKVSWVEKIDWDHWSILTQPLHGIMKTSWPHRMIMNPIPPKSLGTNYDTKKKLPILFV